MKAWKKIMEGKEPCSCSFFQPYVFGQYCNMRGYNMNNEVKYILDILKNNYSIVISEELYDTSMFNPKIGMDARSFLDLICGIEQELEIKFSSSKLCQSDFCTLNGICAAIIQLDHTKS